MKKQSSLPVFKSSKSSTDRVQTEQRSKVSRSSIKWSFTRSARFVSEVPNTVNVPLIAQESMLSQRSTSMGFGNRPATKPTGTPAPSEYYPKPPASRSTIFARTQMPPVPSFLLVAFNAAKDVPGPGAYKTQKDFLFKTKGFLLKGRNKELNPHIGTPGPGHYKPKELRRNLFRAVSFGVGNRSEFTTKEGRAVPGPGAYDSQILKSSQK